MTALLVLLFGFVFLGLFSNKLRGFTYIAMGLMILAYVAYAYGHP